MRMSHVYPCSHMRVFQSKSKRTVIYWRLEGDRNILYGHYVGILFFYSLQTLSKLKRNLQNNFPGCNIFGPGMLYMVNVRAILGILEKKMETTWNMGVV